MEFPIFDAKSRSLKKAVLGKAGGTIGRNSSNVVVIEALRDITLSLKMGDRVGAVDADFLKKAQTRLADLVSRSGILVFASHSNEFLARLCKTAMWIDHGVIRMSGGIEDVVRAYEGEEAARHVREVLAETQEANRVDTPLVQRASGDE